MHDVDDTSSRSVPWVGSWALLTSAWLEWHCALRCRTPCHAACPPSCLSCCKRWNTKTRQWYSTLRYFRLPLQCHTQTPVYGQNLTFRTDAPTVCIICTVCSGQNLYQIEAEYVSFNFIYNLAWADRATVFYMAMRAQNPQFLIFFGELTVF